MHDAFTVPEFKFTRFGGVDIPAVWLRAGTLYHNGSTHTLTEGRDTVVVQDK